MAASRPTPVTAPRPTPQRTVRALTPIVPNGSWPVYHRDDGHTGNDPTLPRMVGVVPGWTRTGLDEHVYASPLVYGGIVYVATLNNTVYALNQIDGSVIWSRNLGAPETGGWGCGNVSPQGILGTPVIDPITGRIYVTKFGIDDIYRVEGLNLATGVVELTTAIPTTGFDWTIEQQRGAMAIHNGYVYVPFGGRYGDCGSYHGYVYAVPTSGAAPLAPYVTPGAGSGFWSAGGVAIDDATGNVFATSGNGVASGCDANGDGSPVFENDAVVRLSSTLAETGFFMPQDWHDNWCITDQDLGSAGPLLISTNLMFQSGKFGNGFLLDPNNLGGVDGQLFPAPKPAVYAGANTCFGNHGDATFAAFAYASPFIYVECEGQGLVALKLDLSVPSAPTFTPCDTCAPPDWNAGGSTTFGPPIVAAGAVWVANGNGLTAFNASTGALLYQSAPFAPDRFVTPAEAGGQVFVSGSKSILSFDMEFGVVQSSPVPSAPRNPPAQSGAAPSGSRSPVPQSSPASSPPTR